MEDRDKRYQRLRSGEVDACRWMASASLFMVARHQSQALFKGWQSRCLFQKGIATCCFQDDSAFSNVLLHSAIV